MGDLIVRPSYQLGPRDILDVDKINLMATPVVELALSDPVNDQNYFRNGNFYSSFWITPAGIDAPAAADTENANYWFVSPVGDTVNYSRATDVPDPFSLFSAKLKGNPNVAVVEFGQQIIGDLSATLRRKCTFSGYIFNSTGLTLSPKLNIYTCNVFNNFNNTTLVGTLDLATVQNGEWGYDTATADFSGYPNMDKGVFIAIAFPSGTLNAATKFVELARLKFQIGEVATEFVDDTSIFVTTPTISAAMLQDGCIARPALFLPNVIPAGTYMAKSVKEPDIDDKAISARTLADGLVPAALGYTPVNKAGDTGLGAQQIVVDTVVGVDSGKQAALIAQLTDANKGNDGYFPAIGLVRDPAGTRRSIGLTVDNRLKTVDGSGAVGYIGDSITKLDTSFYQDKSVTLAKLADDLVKLLISPGVIQMYGGPTIPAGWLACDGSAVLQADFPALFAAIGTYWGGGDASGTQFNLPDLRGRAAIGYVSSPAPGITAHALGFRGGAETVALTTAQLPAHAHAISDPGHNHGIQDPGHNHGMKQAHDAVTTGGGSRLTTDVGVAQGMSPTSVTVINGVTNITGTQNTGGGAAHPTMPPYAVAYYIIKT